jgi:hypothetical protein
MSGVPEPGQVIHYHYLWHNEHLAKLFEGQKFRPCVVFTALPLIQSQPDMATLISVVPITHTKPDPSENHVELNQRAMVAAGIGAVNPYIFKPCYALCDEYNRFAWPGSDMPFLNPPEATIHGCLPNGAFTQILLKIQESVKSSKFSEVDRVDIESLLKRIENPAQAKKG